MWGGEIQAVQHLSVPCAGEAVLAVNGRAVLLHGHSAELQEGEADSPSLSQSFNLSCICA